MAGFSAEQLLNLFLKNLLNPEVIGLLQHTTVVFMKSAVAETITSIKCVTVLEKTAIIRH